MTTENKYETIENIVKSFSADEVKILCRIINSYGDGQHPWATKDTLPFFTRKYVRILVRKALDNTTSIKYTVLYKTVESIYARVK